MPLVTRIKNWLFDNKTDGQTIVKNTFWLFAGQIISRLFRAAIVIYAARLLGAASWGAFSYALGVAAFLTIFSDIGINALITKEAVREPELKNKYLATAFFTKIGFLIFFIVGTIIAFPYLTNIPEAAAIMPILIFVFAFDTLRDLGSAPSRALEKMEIEALVNIFTNLVIVILGFIFLFVSKTSQSLALAYAIGSGLGLLAIIFILRNHFKNLLGNFTGSLVKPILTTAWPFAALGIMGAIMLNTDIIMLGWLRSPEEVGYYSAAQKIIYLLYILPSLLASGIFPSLVRLVKSDSEKARQLLEKTVAVVFLAAVPIAALGMIFGDSIIALLYGSAYQQAVIAFKLLMTTILIVYPSTIIGNAIFAYDSQKSFIPVVGFAIGGNIFFNFLFIPPFGIEGAALATILTQLITNTLMWRKMKTLNQLQIWPQIKSFLKIK